MPLPSRTWRPTPGLASYPTLWSPSLKGVDRERASRTTYQSRVHQGCLVVWSGHTAWVVCVWRARRSRICIQRAQGIDLDRGLRDLRGITPDDRCNCFQWSSQTYRTLNVNGRLRWAEIKQGWSSCSGSSRHAGWRSSTHIMFGREQPGLSCRGCSGCPRSKGGWGKCDQYLFGFGLSICSRAPWPILSTRDWH